MVKIIHCADVHFDSPFVLNDPRDAELRRMEFRSAFSSLVMYAKNFGTKIFLISGDLFNEEYISKDTATLISKEMASYPDCRFFISPGECDPYNAKSPYKQIKWSENVHVFKSSDLTKIEIPELNVDIYGYAFTGNTLQINPFANKKPQNQNRINILVGHGDMTAPRDSQFCPISPSDIDRSGFDYIALGHIHTGTGVLKIGETYFSYPGSLEGRGFHEPGYRGAMCGEIDKGVCDLKAVRFSKRRYETIQVDISQHVTENQIIEAVRLATAIFKEDDTALRVELTGIMRPGFVFNTRSIEEKFTRFNFIQVKNKTSPYIDANTLRYDKTVKGIFFRKLENRLNSQDAKEREEARLALQYGFNAFIGLNIIDF